MKNTINVLVNGHDQKFWFAIETEIKKETQFIFKEDLWSGHNAHNKENSEELLKWADIIICEWALGNAVYYSKNKLAHQKLIIRLHAQEKETQFPTEICYENVDTLVFVGEHIRQECIKKFKIPKDITTLIPNIIDTSKFQQKKFADSDFTLGILGSVPRLKRIDLAYETLQYLQNIDPRYTLRIKGKLPFSYTWISRRESERNFYNEIYKKINSSDLRYKVIFDPFDNNVASWLQHIGYILSPSDRESFHVAAAEGMASSAVPIIWKREGSSEIFPTVIKNNSPKQAAQQIDFYRRTKAGERYKELSTKFVFDNFGVETVSTQWVHLLNREKKASNNLEKKKQNKKLLLFFSIGNWETFHRREMIESLAMQIENEYDIIIIEPGSHYQTILNKNMDSKSNLDAMLALKPLQVQKNIFKIRIMNAGLPKNQKISKILLKNSSYDKAIYKSILDIFGSQIELTYWIQKPLQYKWINQKCKFIYEVYDEYTMDFETGQLKEDVLKAENKVLPLAKHVFFTSKPLAQRKAEKANSWSIVENGVNFDIFSKYHVTSKSTSQKRDSVGYLGNLSNFFNWELISEVVKNMPEIDFIFYGQLELDNLGERIDIAKELMSYKNTVFTGRVTREEGAVGINLVDVLIIPFVINDAMHAVNPLKLWEYFATGKPVVSTPMDAITTKVPMLRTASTAQEWIKEIYASLNEENQEIFETRLQLAQKSSWNELTKKHVKILMA